ncbi:MAG TPA: VOC family protein [Gemmatimonadaceae bacterium]|nr:VOC family protein [Gemmatimonadaceae bacterium]
MTGAGREDQSMPPDGAPHIDVERHHTTLRVADLSAAVAFYTSRLGFHHAFSWGEPPTMAGVNVGETQVFLELGTPAPQGCSLYFVVGDADELHAFHRANDVPLVEPLGDRPWGLRDYTVQDLDGYALTFGHRLQSREPPLEIERIDVPVRLERRLAAVLQDLAARKGMSVSSCLEETLLHTFEPLGDGVASPHTRADLRYIQELRRKHALDYDCHASYRFVERRESRS